MVDQVKLAATAERLIEANGRSATFRKRDRTPENASQPWRGPDKVPTAPDGASVTAIACFVPAGNTSFLGEGRLVAADLSDRFDQVCLVAHDSLPTGTRLEDFSTVEDDSRAWKIARAELLQPGGTRMIYALGLTG